MSIPLDNEQRFEIDPFDTYEPQDEFVGLGAGGTFAAVFIFPVLKVASRFNEHATSFVEVLGPPLSGALVLSTVSALVGQTAAHLRKEFFPNDFPKNFPENG